MQHAGMRIHREKAMIRYSSRESKILKAKEIGESSTASSLEQVMWKCNVLKCHKKVLNKCLSKSSSSRNRQTQIS